MLLPACSKAWGGAASIRHSMQLGSSLLEPRSRRCPPGTPASCCLRWESQVRAWMSPQHPRLSAHRPQQRLHQRLRPAHPRPLPAPLQPPLAARRPARLLPRSPPPPRCRCCWAWAARPLSRRSPVRRGVVRCCVLHCRHPPRPPQRRCRPPQRESPPLEAAAWRCQSR